MPKQIADFLEGGEPRQVMDVIPAIGENTTLAVEITDGRGGGDDIFQAGFALRLSGHKEMVLQ